ncbi:MAG: preprotein translocase subunit SecG [Bryobacteraceae bacterium]
MIILVTIIHVIVSLFLIGVVLLQSGKAADLAGAFGGLGSQTVFGPRGSATVLTRATSISAILFMVTSLSLSLLATGESGGSGGGILDKITAPVQQTGQPAPAPAAPGTPEATPSAPIDPTQGIKVGVGPEGGKPTSVQTIPLPAPTPAKK